MFDHALARNAWQIPWKKETECERREVCLLLTDGVVTYESADIPEALERLIVVSKHNSFKSPEAVSFILEHL